MNRTIALVLFIALVALISCVPALAGGPFTLEAGRGYAHLYGGAYRADNYFNSAGDLRQYDSVKTDFNMVLFGISADYAVTDALELNVEVPVGVFTLTSASRFPDRQIVTPTYFGVGGTYRLSSGNLATAVSAMLRVPPGFHHGIYDDPKHPTFLSDGFLQLNGMLHAGFKYKNIWLKAGAGYTWRDEEPLDEIPFNLELGFSRIEDTGIFLSLSGVVSTGDVTQPLQPFYVGASGSVEERRRRDGGRGNFRTIDRENYFNVGAGAFVYVTDELMIDGRYDLRLFGRNTLAIRGAQIGVGYRFQ